MHILFTFVLVFNCDYIIEVEKFLDEANESLKNELKHVPFKKVNDTIKESAFELGVARNNMEQCLAMYCNTTTSVKSMCMHCHAYINSFISSLIYICSLCMAMIA